jgi:hypothetical protein
MRNTHWALAAGTLAAIVARGGASAQPPTGQEWTVQQEVLVNRPGQLDSETDFRLSDHQQLKDYFFSERPRRGR